MPVKDPWHKTTTVDKPHAVFKAAGWEWRVLKAYQTPAGERKNVYARWFCAVKSPLTYGDWDYGDVYIREIPGAESGHRGEVEE